ncbi:MAG: hypothetical protein D6722_05905 [Bacteroidetes bacterium]|nr:MAG: hypothetical protein D6722_05905 [Bacteroidota bacterium]
MPNLGQYAFLPWMRQGFASEIIETDHLGQGSGGPLERARIPVSIAVNQNRIQQEVHITGPGDILGLNPDAILRTEPRSGVRDFEANFLAYLEFYEEDFPWRYTPARPATVDPMDPASQRLRPWLALVVAKEGEVTLKSLPERLPFITVANEHFDAVFPPHDELWAWAHVSIHGALDLGGQDLDQRLTELLGQQPDLGISRLLCPRKLEKNAAYSAFLVPTFETGRLAGLGEDPTAAPAQQAAWAQGQGTPGSQRPNTFPVYYQWSFRTGNLGDFETLASLLKSYGL